MFGESRGGHEQTDSGLPEPSWETDERVIALCDFNEIELLVPLFDHRRGQQGPLDVGGILASRSHYSFCTAGSVKRSPIGAGVIEVIERIGRTDGSGRIDSPRSVAFGFVGAFGTLGVLGAHAGRGGEIDLGGFVVATDE